MDYEYKYYNKMIGNRKHLESQGYEGIGNYRIIAENIYKISKEIKHEYFVLKHVKSIDKNSSSYQFITTTKSDWVNEYSKEDIVGYFSIEPFQKEGKYYVHGRVKSDSNYCSLSKIIENDKVLF